MKNKTNLLSLSLTTAILCGVWSCIAKALPGALLEWAGFAGCTSYFACGKHGIAGLKKTILPNMAGVVCGLMAMSLGDLVQNVNDWGIWSAIFTFIMCYMATSELFDFCPGTFVGCFSAFAAGGNWKLLVPSLLIGAFLGVACDYSAKWLQKVITERKEESFNHLL